MNEWGAARRLISKIRISEVFPDPDEIRDRVQALAASSRHVRVQEIGASRLGRPIDLVEIGDGDRSALLVGAPHPNEPIGCSTILAMIELFAESPELIARLGYRWNFIPCIEPDGLALNAGWLKGPRTPEHYLEHFYRPSLDQQAEYTFPLQVGDWRFDRPTPENVAWRSALAVTKPDLLASLHNFEFGGAFYILSRELPGLADKLVSNGERAGIYLDDAGDPWIDSPRFQPGVFSFSNFSEKIRKALEAAKDVATVWPAGASSEEYCRTRFGTLGLVQEYPYWNTPKLKDESPSSYRVSDVMPGIRACADENHALLERYLEVLASDAGAESAPFVSALREAHRFAWSGDDEAAEPHDRALSVADHTMMSVSQPLLSLRPVTMLKRLADANGNREAATAAGAILAKRFLRLHEQTTFDVIPLKTLVRLQLEGILAGAEALVAGRG